MTRILQINLFGACSVQGKGPGGAFEIKPAKHRALFALLATANGGRRTRVWLLNMLWGASAHDGGRQSLRTALSKLRTEMAGTFDQVLRVDNTEITLDLSKVEFTGAPGAGEFLEGIDIKDDDFNHWLQGIRQSPDQYFALLRGQAAPAPAARSILPAIAILPFRLVAGEAIHTVLGDWLAEEICRALSRSPLLSVISHLSSREISGQRPDTQRLRRALGVDYAVTGSLRVLGDRIVLDADCIDVASGRILWTRQTQGKMADFLTPDAEAVAEIVRSVGRTVATEAVAQARGRSLKALADHHPLIAGIGMMHELRLSSFSKSRELIEEAIRRAPDVPEAHAWLAEWYVMSIFNGWSDDTLRDAGRAMSCTEQALNIDPDNTFALTIDGVVMNNLFQRLDTAGARFHAALDLNPNESIAWLLSGVLAAYRDDGAEAVERTEQALRLSPVDPFGYFYDSMASTAYLAAEDWGKALSFADRSLQRNDRHSSSLRVKICALNQLGRGEEARSAAAEMKRRQPGFSVAQYRRTHPAADAKIGQRVISSLLDAGLT
ncbi:hypothetical protein [Stagnihabitans tardus]|uniref:TolB amino-terminal domain-containing protein n=1 Tax=Stagnihabitans tardus TaxID=2699202 RepID=A0AAE4Y8Q8_9RHOB|nr:hypothetical protein [Stagnihabitans tardus]NBZ88018.1 hypothetical protein [Stagnihabitans tardus]